MKRFFALSLLIAAVGCGASTTSQSNPPPPPGGTPTPSATPTGGSGGNTSGPAVTLSADHTTGMAPLPVSFTANVTGGSGNVTLAWSFGDGTNGSGLTSSHTYSNPGSYSATVTATDSQGHNGHATLVIAVGSATHPVVAAGATPASGAAPLTVSFQANAAGGNGTLSYAWNFGDASSATNTDTTQTPSHVFNAKGSYTAKVTVTDASGNASTASVTIVVNDPPTGGGGGGGGGGTPTPTPLPDLQVTNFTATESGLSDPYEPNDSSAYYLGDYNTCTNGCTVSDAYIDEKDTTYTATVVNFGAAITDPFDVDFYYNQSSQPNDGDYGSDYQTIASMDANSTQDVSFTVTGPAAGVATTSWIRADSGSAITEADETNNDASTDFTPTGDQDWFAVSEDGGYTLTISLTNMPADYDLYLLDANGNQVASSENSGTTDESISYLTPGSTSGSPSLYFIGVVPYQGAYDSSNPYTLTVTVP